MKVMGNQEVQEMEQTGVRKCNGMYQEKENAVRACSDWLIVVSVIMGGPFLYLYVMFVCYCYVRCQIEILVVWYSHFCLYCFYVRVCGSFCFQSLCLCSFFSNRANRTSVLWVESLWFFQCPFLMRDSDTDVFYNFKHSLLSPTLTRKVMHFKELN